MPAHGEHLGRRPYRQVRGLIRRGVWQDQNGTGRHLGQDVDVLSKAVGVTPELREEGAIRADEIGPLGFDVLQQVTQVAGLSRGCAGPAQVATQNAEKALQATGELTGGLPLEVGHHVHVLELDLRAVVELLGGGAKDALELVDVGHG